MFSKIILNKENLLNNIGYIKNSVKGKICVMVKAEGYGHGARQIVSILKEEVDYFGVSNEHEALVLREETDKTVIVFGACEDYLECMKKEISFALMSYYDAKKIIKLALKNGLVPKFHLCLNTGMNRYGVKTFKEYMKILNLLQKYNLELEGLYTHFSSLSTDEAYTKMQKQKFYQFVEYLPEDWHTLVHVGGGRSIVSDIDADMYRVGLECYGYGGENLRPVMRVESRVVDIQHVAKGEHVGYLCGYTADRDIVVATIPLGYGDGLPRKLSNKLYISINNKKVKSCGNICMDAFMVDITDINCKLGDCAVIMDDASQIAPLIESTEYEVLTNFAKFRGERIIL